MIFGIGGLSPLEQLSLAIPIIGIVSYYFGKLISDAMPEKEVKSVSYIHGFGFLIMLIIFPSLVIYYLNQEINFINLLKPYWGILFIIQYILVYFLYLKHISFIANLYGMEDYIQKTYKKAMNYVLKKKIKLSNESIKRGRIPQTMSCYLKFMYRKMSNLELFLISTFIIFATLIVWQKNPGILFVSLTLVVLFIGFSSLAILYGFYTANYPYIKIVLKNGKTKTGKVIKYEGDFFTIIDKGIKYFFNKNEIISIETPILKKNKLKR